MKLILTSAFFLTLIISVFGSVCWQGSKETGSEEGPIVGANLQFRCSVNPKTGEFELGNSKNQII